MSFMALLLLLSLGYCGIVKCTSYGDKNVETGDFEKVRFCTAKDRFLSICDIFELAPNTSNYNIHEDSKAQTAQESILDTFLTKETSTRRIGRKSRNTASFRRIRSFRTETYSSRYNPERNNRLSMTSFTTGDSLGSKEVFRRSLLTMRRERLLSEDENRNRLMNDNFRKQLKHPLRLSYTDESSLRKHRIEKSVTPSYRRVESIAKNSFQLFSRSNVIGGGRLSHDSNRRSRIQTRSRINSSDRSSLMISPNREIHIRKSLQAEVPILRMVKKSFSSMRNSRKNVVSERRYRESLPEQLLRNVDDSMRKNTRETRVNVDGMMITGQLKLAESRVPRQTASISEEMRKTQRTLEQRYSTLEIRTPKQFHSNSHSQDGRLTRSLYVRSRIDESRRNLASASRVKIEDNPSTLQTRDSRMKFDIGFHDDWQQLNKFSYLRINSPKKIRIGTSKAGHADRQMHKLDYVVTRFLEMVIATVVIISLNCEKGKSPVWSVLHSAVAFAEK